MTKLTIPHIVDQHAVEASFLWQLRDRAVTAPHYDLDDLAKFDGRVEAHLDGLRVAGDAGWNSVFAQLEAGGPGEVFAASVLAFEGGQAERIMAVFEQVVAKPVRLTGMIAALGWLPWPQVEMQVRRLVARDMAPLWRQAGLAAASIHRQNLGGLLEDALLMPDPRVKTRALEAVGELGLIAQQPHVRRQLTSPDHAIRFASAWTAALLRPDAEAIAILRAFAQSQSPYGDQAVLLAARRLELREAHRWRDRLLVEPHSCRRALQAAGALGDPEGIPFLIDAMKSPGLARLAGDAFSLITGVDLTKENLEAEPPAKFQAGPSEDPNDDNVALDPDENLPWPAVTGIARWWQANQGSFARGTRHLCGKPITLEWLRHVLRTGKQRQRYAAALERAILQPGRPLFETRAPARRQQQWLEAEAKATG